MNVAKPDPLIIYVPGLMPKPEPRVHRQQLMRCLLEGIRRIHPEVADDIGERSRCFDVVSWTYDFYGQHRDINIDLPGIEALLKQEEATEHDVMEAVSWKRRLVRNLYRIVDLLPFLVPKLANEQIEIHLRDLRRYNNNENGRAEFVRRLLKVPLEAASLAGRPILLLAHSMGSVISYDALWELSRQEHRDVIVDRFMTLGSPLGQQTIQRRLKGRAVAGENRYPGNIRQWTNISAVGELTALDTELKNDFGVMEELGLIEKIDDHEFFNFFRLNGMLNVHAEYGYLINEVTARHISEWWCAQRDGDC